MEPEAGPVRTLVPRVQARYHQGTTAKKRQPTGETNRKGGGGAEKSREEGSAVGWLQEGGRVRGGRGAEVRVRKQWGRILLAPVGARMAG